MYPTTRLITTLILMTVLSACSQYATRANLTPGHTVAGDPTLSFQQAVEQLTDSTLSRPERQALAHNIAKQVHFTAKLQDPADYQSIKESLNDHYDPAYFGALEDFIWQDFLTDVDLVGDLAGAIDEMNVGGGDFGFGGEAGSMYHGNKANHQRMFDTKEALEGNFEDLDGDGLKAPEDIDNDGDGHSDAQEDVNGTDPNDPNSKPEDEEEDVDDDNKWKSEDDLWSGPGCPGGTAHCFNSLLDSLFEIQGDIDELFVDYTQGLRALSRQDGIYSESLYDVLLKSQRPSLLLYDVR
jgi:hypothetical protein